MADYGKKLISWEFHEYHPHERGRLWYIVFFVVAALLVIYSVFTANWLFLIIIVIVSALYVVNNRRPPARLHAALWEDGLTVESKLYPYDVFEAFWIIYKPPESKYLYLRLKGALRPDLVLQLDDANPVEIRNVLLDYIPEDATKEEESVAETLGKHYKL